MKSHFPPALLALLALSLPSPADPVFLERGGLVVIEAESTSSRLGKWIKKTDVEDYQGECHLEFTGNKPTNGPPNSPLQYEFKISKGGKYSLVLRARKRLISERQDICNDCFVAVKGDFEPGGTAPLKVLESDTKMYGGNAHDWGWASRLDVNHKKYPAEYLFKEGETYTLTISGRSQNFNLDRILFVHESRNLREDQQKNPPESKTASANSGGLPERITRTLTNTEGKTVSAELVDKTETHVVARIKGRRHELALETLSEEDRKFIREWEPE